MKRFVYGLITVLLVCSLTACTTTQTVTVSEQVLSDGTPIGVTKQTDEKKQEAGTTTLHKNTSLATKTTLKGQTTMKTSVKKTYAKGTAKTYDDLPFYTDSLQTLVKSGQALPNGRAKISGSALQLQFSYAGFTVCGQLQGEVSALVEVLSGNPNPVFKETLQVVIDGDLKNAKRIVVSKTKTVILAENLPAGNHTITVTKGNCYTNSITNVQSLSYIGKLDKPKRRALQIEFIGDSVTSAVSTENGKSDVLSDSGFDGYAPQVAAALNADLSVISRSGGDVPLLTSLFNDKEWDFQNNPRDIVVINLGTNDWGWSNKPAAASISGLQKKCHALLTGVREKYGKDTYIIWAYGMMFDKDKEFVRDQIVNEFKTTYQDNRVLFCDLSAARDNNGNAQHPSKAGHANAANILTQFIKSNCL